MAYGAHAPSCVCNCVCSQLKMAWDAHKRRLRCAVLLCWLPTLQAYCCYRLGRFEEVGRPGCRLGLTLACGHHHHALSSKAVCICTMQQSACQDPLGVLTTDRPSYSAAACCVEGHVCAVNHLLQDGLHTPAYVAVQPHAWLTLCAHILFLANV